MEFSINRILLLVRREWIKNGRKIIIGISSAVGLALIFSILGVFDGGINAAYYSYPVSVFFIVGGAIIFSASFTEWDKTETGYQILTLPASNLEKLTSSWLVGFLIYTVLSAVFISLGYAILAILDASGLNVIGEYMDASWVIKLLSTHLLTTFVFFLGAAAFKGTAFFKTLLAIIIVFFGGSAFMSIVGYILFQNFNPESFGAVNLSIDESIFKFTLGKNSYGYKSLLIISNFIYFFFLAVVSYFKIKEREL